MKDKYDVVVCGAGMAGIGAAIAAARTGAGTDGGVVYRMDLKIALQLSADHGTTDPAPGIHTNNCGTRLTLTASPDAHYHFDGWSGSTGAITGGDAGSATVTVTLTTPVSLAAAFESPGRAVRWPDSSWNTRMT